MREIKEFKLYTVPEVAELLSLNPQTVKQFIREGRIKAKKVGRRYLILGEAILDYLNS